MIELKTPRGVPVHVPEVLTEDPSPRFSADDAEHLRAYYEENGYVIGKSVIAPEVCDTQRKLWEDEVKTFRGYIYRQVTAKAEKHVFNENGWVMNPILNLQSVGNSATWEHQDSYYLDSEKVGEMTAAWIAMGLITARAGRFFVCPKSHKIRLDDHSLANNVAQHHEVYIASVADEIKSLKLEIRAPALDKGDVLFWSSLTIHGSLNSQDPHHSRSSITCHAIPSSRLFMSHQSRLRDVSTNDGL